jgi:hypothetical protein
MAILQSQLSSMSAEQMLAEMARLRAENEALRAKPVARVTMKVSEKGALSLYGMGRFPVTMYKEQWLRVLAMGDDIRAFITAHEGQLRSKGD